MDTGEKFLNRTPIAYAIDKWDLIKLKSFFKAKDTVRRTKNVNQQTGKGSSPTLNPTAGQ